MNNPNIPFGPDGRDPIGYERFVLWPPNPERGVRNYELRAIHSGQDLLATISSAGMHGVRFTDCIPWCFLDLLDVMDAQRKIVTWTAYLWEERCRKAKSGE